jgi:hypothetical protein
MKIKYFFTLLLLILSLLAKSQDKKSILKNQAQEMSQASINGNYDLVLKYTYPKIVEEFGGSENFIAEINKAMGNLKAEGTQIEKVEIGESGDFFKAGDELHSILNEKITLNTKKGKFLIDSYLLAISSDNGQNWFFIDCNIGKDFILSFLPNFNNELIIPEINKPIKI